MAFNMCSYNRVWHEIHMCDFWHRSPQEAVNVSLCNLPMSKQRKAPRKILWHIFFRELSPPLEPSEGSSVERREPPSAHLLFPVRLSLTATFAVLTSHYSATFPGDIIKKRCQWLPVNDFDRRQLIAVPLFPSARARCLLIGCSDAEPFNSPAILLT